MCACVFTYDCVCDATPPIHLGVCTHSRPHLKDTASRGPHEGRGRRLVVGGVVQNLVTMYEHNVSMPRALLSCYHYYYHTLLHNYYMVLSYSHL